MNETDDEARPVARAVPDRALLTDAQWARLAPLLPPQQPKTGSRGGRPNKDHWLVVEGMLGILRTGAPWRDLPKDYGRDGPAGAVHQLPEVHLTALVERSVVWTCVGALGRRGARTR